MKHFFQEEIPVWITVLVLGLVTLGAIFAFLEFHQIVYSYSFTLPVEGSSTAYTYGSWAALNNEDYYDKVLNGLVAEKATFIDANLSTMQLQYYIDGTVTTTLTILAKGRPGSWWETPAGLYKVQAKSPAEFSDIAQVYSPWALDFQGNFLIHGWPYYPNGTPVGSTYSGGCIRLSTPDAEALYNMVAVGTPVLVSSADFEPDTFQEQTQGPPISATSYLAGDIKSNFILAEKNPDEQLPIASLTKLMTALVAIEYVNIQKTITITPDMLVKTSIPRLKAGEQLSLYDLLQPLLKESSNEAAVAISDFLGTPYFVSLMNQTAQSIGMTNTHYVDPSGSDWGNVSTARDMFILAQYLYNNRSFILKMTTNDTTPNVYGPSAFPTLQNFNVFANDPNFVGGKVGINGAASDTILSVFNEPFAATAEGVSTTTDSTDTSTVATVATTSIATRPIAFVILGSNDYTSDAENFLSWINATYGPAATSTN
jgi:D-alanyl-D-alanine carboxypeptidase/L,D-transpeptidase catalytic domain